MYMHIMYIYIYIYIYRLYSHLENKHISCWTPCFMRTIISSNKKADFFLENNADFSLHNWRHFSIIEKKYKNDGRLQNMKINYVMRFESRYLRRCRHFDMISLLAFSRLRFSAVKIKVFSIKHRLH